MIRHDLRLPRCPACGMIWSHDCVTCRAAMPPATPLPPLAPPRESRFWSWLFAAELAILAVLLAVLACFAVARP